MSSRSRRHASLGLSVVLSLAMCELCGPRAAFGQPLAFIGSWPSVGLPLGLVLDAGGRLYMPNEHAANLALRVFTQSGVPLGIIGSGAGFECYGAAVLSDQTLIVSDYYGRRALRYAQDGSLLSQWWTGGDRAGRLAVDASDNVYIVDDTGDVVRRFSSEGVLLAQWPMAHPGGVACVNGLVYVTETFNGKVNIYTPDGVQQGSFATGCTFASQLYFDAVGGLLYLTDHGLHQLKCFTTDGTLLWTMGPAVPGYPYATTDLFSIVVAPDGTVLVGDYANRNVLIFSQLPTPAAKPTFGALKSRYRGEREAVVR